MMLLEQVAERFFGEFLQPSPAIQTKLVERMPSLAIEFNPAADGAWTGRSAGHGGYSHEQFGMAMVEDAPDANR